MVSLARMFVDAVTPGRPWESISDFATHPSFCGNRLYPRQVTALRLAHLDTDHMTDYDRDIIDEWSRLFRDKAYTLGVQEDIWVRVEANKAEGRDHFRTILAVMGRRAGKGHIGGVLLAERLAHLVALDDPQAFYGIQGGHDIYALVAATTAEQAQKFLFADVLAQVRGCVWLQDRIVRAVDHEIRLRTPADSRREATLRAGGVGVSKPLTSVVALPVSSNSAASRGGATLAVGFDEFAFMRTGTSSHMTDEAAWNAITPSMDQFGKDALTYVPSSPWTKMGKFFRLYEEGARLLEELVHAEGGVATGAAMRAVEETIVSDAARVAANPEILIMQQESWGLYEDWEMAPWVLRKPLPHPTVAPTAGSLAVSATWPPGRAGEAAVAPAVQDLGGFLEADGVLWRVVGDSVTAPTLTGATPVEPGPTFAGPIQTRPDPDGPPQAQSMHRLEQSDPQLFRVERRGQFRVVQSPYIHPDRVDAIFAPWQGERLEQRPRGRTDIEYWAHIDPAKTGADMAMCVGHTEKVGGRLHLVVDQTRVWRARDYPDQIIDYLRVVGDLEDVLLNYPTLTRLSMDQFNSIMPMQHLQKWLRDRGRTHTRVVEETFTAKLNERMWAVLKTAVNEGLVHVPEDRYAFDGGGCLMREELLVLEEDGEGRVVKPSTGPVSHDDLVDCLGVLALRLLGDDVSEARAALDVGAFGMQGGLGGVPKPSGDPLDALRRLRGGRPAGGGGVRW